MKLVVDDQPSEVFQSSERSFNNPSLWYHLDFWRILIKTKDNLQIAPQGGF